MISVYVGAAIDLASNLNAFDEISKLVIEQFPDAIIFRPDKAWNNAINVSPDKIKYLMDVNNYSCENADLGVFFISPTTFSMGVPLEIELRVKANKTVFVVAEKKGLYLKGLLEEADENSKLIDNFEDLKAELEQYNENLNNKE